MQYELEDIDTEYFINKINNNIGELSYKTNVSGQITDWNTFVDDKKFNNILNNFFDQVKPFNIKSIGLVDAWGIKVNEGHATAKHNHEPYNYSACLYLNDVESEIYYPQLNLKLEIKKNMFLFWSAWLNHFTPKVKKGIKYALVCNFQERKSWSK